MIKTLLLACALLVPSLALAQLPVTAATDQERLVADADPALAANKRLVYDFWREVFEAGHMDAAERYMTESYIQHNPNVATGRAAFVAFFSKVTTPKPIEPRIKAPLVAIVADGDLVILAFVKTAPDPKDASVRYTTTWFDMLRIENGRIAEHWDPAQKP